MTDRKCSLKGRRGENGSTVGGVTKGRRGAEGSVANRM